MRNRFVYILFAFTLLLSVNGCVDDENFTDSIFVDQEELNPESPSYNFDLWLNDNFLTPYNLSFKYRMVDVGSDMNYNLVPASIEKSKQLAQLIKYLWFDVYATMVNEEFLKQYGPRIIHLIGSPAYNPNSGTILLGTAEGGIKVTLYRCNKLDYNDTEAMNEFYFHTMHHEFTHILHQTKSYPKEYEKISAGSYSPLGWQYLSHQDAAALGFVTPYAASQAREDFVEVISTYLVKSDEDWNAIIEQAGSEGADQIIEKLSICTAWLKDKWGIELDKMKHEINTRQQNINADFFDKNL